MSVDCGDDRDRQIHERPEHPLEEFVLARPLKLGHAIAFLQVAAGAEDLFAGSRQDNAADFARLCRQPIPQVEHIVPHLRIDRIAHGWTVQRHLEDMIADHVGGDGFVSGQGVRG